MQTYKMAPQGADDNAPAVKEQLLMNDRRQSQNASDSDTNSEMVNSRETWGKKAEYFLSIIGYCVGLGNIWRFPYVCMRNGGGAFLIPFFLALFVCAYPLYFLEMSLAQFVAKSPWHVWNIVPLFRGIGISMNILCLLIGWYYSMILAWCLIYMVNSFKNPLPWTQCGQSWNSENCIEPTGYGHTELSDLNSTTTASVLLSNNTNDKYTLGNRIGFTTETTSTMPVPSTEEFWFHNVLELTSGIDDMGGINWHGAVALTISNVVILVAVIKGIHSSGKVVYVTATLPYILLGVIFIMGCTLPGSVDGILFYIKPDFNKLFRIRTWVEAAIQVFYSLGPCWGCLLTMASYNKFHYNCLRDSILLVCICEGTSVFGGFAIFTILGHMAYVAQVPIMQFAKSGSGLAFIVYPEAVSYLPIPQLWGFLFFLMLFTVGLDSQFANVETIITTMADIWPRFMKRWRITVTILVMMVFILTGLVFTARGGGYVFQIVDWYIAAFTHLLQGCLEIVTVAWFYGANRFCYDIQLMIGRRPPMFIVFAWKFISPFLLLILFGFTLKYYEPPTFAGYDFPIYSQVIGWTIAVLPFSSIVLFAIVALLRANGTFQQRVKACIRPPANWGPSNPEAREKYHYVGPSYGFLEWGLPCQSV